ncbi:hypothetical protein TVNIR_0284 [Thioalkalivibrio nitratireducens DSM 14787]|uniref:Uncharacterized protein n=1 Tax=Thioalkalivibrio nitratireducens (strain DSM 14787 / UNIQEM 213 / ALEN2) TaxID=1255043 RepID=L0DSN5_THIND|nr:hypothetical protein TVNIR_0284 [Thioalkalivibrio nitratireducens DSM 14787]
MKAAMARVRKNAAPVSSSAEVLWRYNDEEAGKIRIAAGLA